MTIFIRKRTLLNLVVGLRADLNAEKEKLSRLTHKVHALSSEIDYIRNRQFISPVPVQGEGTNTAVDVRDVVQQLADYLGVSIAEQPTKKARVVLDPRKSAEAAAHEPTFD